MEPCKLSGGLRNPFAHKEDLHGPGLTGRGITLPATPSIAKSDIITLKQLLRFATARTEAHIIPTILIRTRVSPSTVQRIRA